MFKKLLDYVVDLIKEEYKFLISMILIFIILNFPINYYIFVGGGVSEMSSRISVDNKYESKGSFNLSYVVQLDATVLSYLLSYVIPTWERESVDSYKYVKTESAKDVDFRSDIDLKAANNTATYWAYTLADKKIEELSSKLYVISVDNDNFKSNLKIRDEIISVDGTTYSSVNEMREYLNTKNASDKIKIKVLRDGNEEEIESELTDVDGKLLLGIIIQELKEYETDPKIQINFLSSESGPSAGLITTLEIYNQLTKKDLTKGRKIAGTGTIESDGSIGEIGGIRFKLLGAYKDKVDYFLCPKDNYKEAKNYIKKNNMKIKLIKVNTIEDAIKKLEELD